MDKYIETLILSSKNPDLSELISKLSSDMDEYLNIMGQFISVLHRLDADRETIESVLSQWSGKEERPENAFLSAAETFVCSNEDLRFVVRKLETLPDIRYMIDGIMENPSFGQVLNRLLYAYEDSMTNDDLIDLKEHLEEYQKTTNKRLANVSNYIDRCIKINAKIPKWVSLNPGESNMDLEQVSYGLDKDDNELILTKLREEASKLNVKGNIDNYIDMFSSTMSDIVDVGTNYNKSFRVWGPENRFFGRDCVGNPGGIGPCRMFRCLCRPGEDEEMGIWFTGKCDNCSKKIVNLSHAVRYPAKGGGWRGCYCSFHCISQLPPYQMNKEDNVRLKKVETDVETIGIMDRSVL